MVVGVGGRGASEVDAVKRVFSIELFGQTPSRVLADRVDFRNGWVVFIQSESVPAEGSGGYWKEQRDHIVVAYPSNLVDYVKEIVEEKL